MAQHILFIGVYGFRNECFVLVIHAEQQTALLG